MNVNPKVSIVIPVYNGSNYLREAIESALDQTYKNIEVIVVNDGSNDSGQTEAIAKSYGNRIRYFYKENGGVASALNYAIHKMTGDYFSWLSHDDVYFPDKIEKQINYLKNEKEDIIVYSNFELIDSNSKTICIHKTVYTDPQYFLFYLIGYYPISGCTAIVPKKCFDDIGDFNQNLRTTQDYEMWFRMALKYKFKHIPDVLVKSRVHPEQGTVIMRNYVLDEGNKLYIWCLNNLLRSKIVPFEKSYSLYLVKVAFRLKEIGFSEASKHAFILSYKNFEGSNLMEILNYISILLFNLILFYPKYVVKKVIKYFM